MLRSDAAIIAEAFILGLIGTDIKWTEEIPIANSIAMYDEDGNVSAYSFELTTGEKDTGYIIVSVRMDVPNAGNNNSKAD